MRGRFDGFRNGPSPRPPFRLIRLNSADPFAEPQVLEETKFNSELSLKMIPQGFGFQWKPYARAAAKALRTAAHDVHHAACNNPDLQEHQVRLNNLATEVEALVAGSLPTSTGPAIPTQNDLSLRRGQT